MGAQQQELQAARDDGEKVVEMVRHARGHLAERAHRFALHQPRLRRPQIFDDRLQPLRVQPCVLEQARVLEGIGDVGHERAQELQVHRRERARVHGRGGTLGEVDHADDAVLDADRQPDDGAVVDEAGLADLRDLARHALAQRQLGADGSVIAPAARGDHAQDAAMAVEQHDGARGPAHRAHRALEHEREQLRHVRHARRQLDDLVQSAELEHQLLQPLRGAAQVVEHARERVADLADLRHAAQARDDGPVALAPARARPDERAGQLRHAAHHQAEHDEAQHGQRDREQHRNLGLEAPERSGAVQNEDDEQEGQERGQREHDRRRLAQTDAAGGAVGGLHGKPL